jgi:hydroxypyruvate isomerase
VPRFAANLTMLWPELEHVERFRAARDAGFRQVERLFAHDLDADRLEWTLRELDLEMILFDPEAGDWSAGERGLLCLPGREEQLRQTVLAALALARRIGTRRLNVLAGIAPPEARPEELRRIAVANLSALAPLAAADGVTLLVEAINTVDMPGYALPTIDVAASVVREVNHPAVALQFDQYHVAMSGDDSIRALRKHHAIVRHVQIADVPGRHEPGTGSGAIRAFLKELDRLGYDGHVGLEYRPLRTTDESLAWLPREARASALVWAHPPS